MGKASTHAPRKSLMRDSSATGNALSKKVTQLDDPYARKFKSSRRTVKKKATAASRVSCLSPAVNGAAGKKKKSACPDSSPGTISARQNVALVMLSAERAKRRE